MRRLRLLSLARDFVVEFAAAVSPELSACSDIPTARLVLSSRPERGVAERSGGTRISPLPTPLGLFPGRSSRFGGGVEGDLHFVPSWGSRRYICSVPRGLYRFHYSHTAHFINFTCCHRHPPLADPTVRHFFVRALERSKTCIGL